MMINKGRKANKNATAEEKRRLNDPGWARRQREAERLESKEAWANEMKERGHDVSKSYLFETAERAQGRDAARQKKEKGKAAFGWDVFNKDSLNKAYEKRVDSLPQGEGGGEVAAVPSVEYGQAPRPTEAALDQMVSELEGRADQQRKFSRRRTEVPGADVDFINDRNQHFNKKIKRAYDKYTVEIRQNLERGTAL